MSQRAGRPFAFSEEFGKRVVSALLLAPLGVAVAFFGGWFAIIVTSVVAMVIAAEWNDVTSHQRSQRWLVFEYATTCGLGLMLGFNWHAAAVISVAVLAGLVAVLSRRSTEKAWAAGGLLYALILPLSVVIVLDSVRLGFEAAVFICFVVWTTDVFAYFAGKALGGPKLWPAISPKKTWAGFIGGLAGGVLAGFVLAYLLGVTWTWPLAALSLSLSLASHGGDLFESWVKRCFDKKDSGHLIPGHGGFMDRIDGLLAAFLAALIIGGLRGGLDNCGAGLLSW